MNNESLINGLVHMKKSYKKMLELADECVELDINNNQNELMESLTDLLIESEKSTVRMHKLIAKNFDPNDYNLLILKEIKNPLGIEISIDENYIMTIKMPLVLPFKKIKSYRSKLSDSKIFELNDMDLLKQKALIRRLGLDELYEKINAISFSLDRAMKKFIFDSNTTHGERKYLYSEATYAFTHFYDFDYKGTYPDPDNYEYKQLIDVVAEHLSFGDDSNLTIVIRNKLSSETYTELKIYPSNYDLIP